MQSIEYVGSKLGKIWRLQMNDIRAYIKYKKDF